MSDPKFNWRARDLIVANAEDTMVAVVMMLTGGSANPDTVLTHVRRIKAELGERSFPSYRDGLPIPVGRTR